MRFFIDGRMDTRPLDSQDIPHAGLPYNFVPLIKRNESIIASCNTQDIFFTAVDWGVGKNFYVYRMVFDMQIIDIETTLAYTQFNHGITIIAKDLAIEGTVNIDSKNFTPMTHPAIWCATAGFLYGSIDLLKTKIGVDATLGFTIVNQIGADIGIEKFKISISGVAV